MCAERWQLDYRPIVCRPARALYVQPDGTMYVSRYGRIFRSKPDSGLWEALALVPRPYSRRVAELSRMACRLLRHEVKALGLLPDGALVAADRLGVYHAAPGSEVMSPASIEDYLPQGKPPMTLTVGPQDRILWGEYNSKTNHGLPIRLYASDDRGRSYHVAWVFEGGDILHVHSLRYDQRNDCYWLFAGDHGRQAGIGRLSTDLRSLEWVARGEQSFRAVEVFDCGEYFVYGTDSELEPNHVVRFDKKTGRAVRMQALPGSCIYACRFGEWRLLSTTVEPSRVNESTDATLWASRDGETWCEVYRARKDKWPPVYFQFGSIVLPRGESASEEILFSGQALEGVDGRAFVGRLCIASG